MKRIVLLLVAMFVLLASSAWGAGSCTQSLYRYQTTDSMLMVKFVCTGDSGNGSIPNTAISTANMAYLLGKFYLYSVTAYPTVGGTAPDAADVFILGANLEDLLGSVDGGTTANKGANLIHATLTKTTLPYSGYLSQHYFPAITGTLTLKVANQATNSANYTIDLLFAR